MIPASPASRFPFLPFAAAVLLASAALRAQDGVPGSVQTIDGRTLTGATTIDAGGKVVVRGESGEATVTLAEVLAFARADVVSRPTDAPHRVWLRSGFELPAVRIAGKPPATGSPAQLTVELPSGVVLDVPLGTVRAIRHGGKERPEPALFAADLQKPSDSTDLIYVVKDGKAQRSAVTVKAVSGERIDFLLRDSAYDFELSGLCGVVFGSTTGFAPDRQGKPRTRIVTTTGEQLEGRLQSFDARGAVCRLDEGAVVTVPIDRTAALQVASDRLAWLTERRPAKVEQTPAFDRTWPWSTERTPAGPGFVLGGKSFARGLCLVPRTALTFDLDGKYDVFEATIGIDDRTGPDAHAIFRVLVDGKPAFTSEPMTRGKPAVAVRVELHKAKSLTLDVDFGKNYDLGDYCVFADPRVVQQ
ncbi:MAG: NPCBM/NEW2 domain-containing protein [Planctomycetes bacterium]|nr:NPCBM/NEW2 domain-containing protein [Planctomycetota bacterium]